MTLDRRSVLQLSALLGVALALPDLSRAASVEPPADAEATVAALADAIIPPTDTPGAVAAGVVPFILLMVDEWFTPDERSRFWTGFAQFAAGSQQDHGAPFHQLAPVDRVAILTKAFDGSVPRAGFLDIVKRLTIFGYYTSEIGASQELEYNMGGQYVPDAPIDPDVRAPSLSRRFHTFSMA